MAHYDKDVYRNGRLLRKAGEPVTMWKLIVDRQMPPTRKARFCCAVLKEPNGKGRVTVTGVRWEESINRKRTHGLVDLQGAVKQTAKVAADVGAETKNNGRGTLILNNDNDASRQVVEHCFQKAKTTINPIIDWTEDDVWEFLNDVVKVPHCELYDQGWNRLGCIGCPMASVEERRRSFEEWPKYKDAYIRAFQRMIDEKSETAGVQYSQRLEHEDETSLTPPENNIGRTELSDSHRQKREVSLALERRTPVEIPANRQQPVPPPERNSGSNPGDRCGTIPPTVEQRTVVQRNQGTDKDMTLPPPDIGGTRKPCGKPGLPVPDWQGIDGIVGDGSVVQQGSPRSAGRYSREDFAGASEQYHWQSGTQVYEWWDGA